MIFYIPDFALCQLLPLTTIDSSIALNPVAINDCLHALLENMLSGDDNTVSIYTFSVLYLQRLLKAASVCYIAWLLCVFVYLC